MPTADSVPLLTAMRTLQSALDCFDRDAAEALGLGRSDAQALRFLVEHGPASPGALMVELGLTSGSVTALVDRLERAGFTRRRPHQRDRRSLTVEATEAGASALQAATRPLADLTCKLSTRLNGDRSGAVVRQLADLARLVDWAGRSSA